MKASEVSGLADFSKIGPKLYISANSRALTRMLTVSHGTFMAIDAAQTTVRAAHEDKCGKAAVAVRLLFNVNVVGVGRFAVACKADAKYIADDITELCRSYVAERCGQAVDPAGLKGLDRLALDSAKVRLLKSPSSTTGPFGMPLLQGRGQASPQSRLVRPLGRAGGGCSAWQAVRQSSRAAGCCSALRASRPVRIGTNRRPTNMKAQAGSKVPTRSLGTEISTSPTAPRTHLGV